MTPVPLFTKDGSRCAVCVITPTRLRQATTSIARMARPQAFVIRPSSVLFLADGREVLAPMLCHVSGDPNGHRRPPPAHPSPLDPAKTSAHQVLATASASASASAAAGVAEWCGAFAWRELGHGWSCGAGFFLNARWPALWLKSI